MSARSLPDENELSQLAATIADRIRALPRQEGGTGGRPAEPADLKAGHAIDRRVAAFAREALAGHPCNLVIEGETAESEPGAAFCVYIDPVDGSLNWDRGVGDPAFVLAVAAGPCAGSLDDLRFAQVEGLRSGDRYRTAGGAAFHRCAATGREARLQVAAPARLAEATGYLRAGYGGARSQLARTLPLYLGARDLRAVDNAAIEFGDIARNAAHFMVEARSLSDGFNLLAWPVVRAAGGVLRGLDGGALASAPFDPGAIVDFVLAGSARLADEILERMERFARRDRARFEALLEGLD